MARYNGVFQGVEKEGNWYGGSVRFSWDAPTEKIIARLGFGKKLHKYMADVVLSYCGEFIPYKTGDLYAYAQTFGAKDHGTITFQKPYASKQYYLTGRGYKLPDNSKRTRDINELATSLWDKYAWKTYKAEITQEVDDERIRICRTQE